MFIIIAAALPLLATPGLKIEEVIAHENVQQEQEITIEENLHGGKVLVLSNGMAAMMVLEKNAKRKCAWLPSIWALLCRL